MKDRGFLARFCKRGYEFPLALLAMGVGIGLTGPGIFSLDALFGIALPYPWVSLVLAVAALLVDVIGLIISRPAAVQIEVKQTEVKSSAS